VAMLDGRVLGEAKAVALRNAKTVAMTRNVTRAGLLDPVTGQVEQLGNVDCGWIAAARFR
jgi:hypothetical protein